MKLTTLKFEEVSSLTYELASCPLPPWNYLSCLIIAFKGECGHGSGSNQDAAFMAGIIRAANEVWPPVACILDLRELEYEWGDEIARVFDTFDACRVGDSFIAFPLAVVISDKNRVGLTSLVREEMGQSPDEILFETLNDAFTAVEDQARRIYPTP